MTTVVVSFENRDLKFKGAFRQNHQDYCDIHGYKYVALDSHHMETQLPPYWLKVFIVRELLMDTDNDIIMWIDSDAKFESNHTSVSSMICENKSIALSKDKPIHKYPGKINTGVFIVNKNSIFLLDRWMNKYSPAKWTNNDGEWTCSGKWAGEDYEQGSLELLIDNSFLIHEWFVMNNHPNSGHRGFVQHFCGRAGKKLLKKIKCT